MSQMEDRMENYEKMRVVGRGAYGVCWLCRRKGDIHNEKVIIKSIALHGVSPEEEKAIMGEVNLLQRMNNPMIIGFLGAFMAENNLAIVMQYAEGGTMEKMIQDQQGEKFAEATVLNYFTQLLVALNYIHAQHIVHRDLKTQNILLNRKRTLVKLSDFGISKELSTRSVASTVIGTPHYLSPEICEGRAYNQKSDLWSLGCVLYELLQLKRAFDGENLPSIVMKITKCAYPPLTDCSVQVTELVAQLLQLNEKKRPDIKELLTCPLVLPVTLSLHLDVGRLQLNDKNDKRKPSVAGRLRTTPNTLTLKSAAALSPSGKQSPKVHKTMR